MAIIEIKSLNEPGIEVFSTLTDPLPYSANGNT